MTLTEALAYWRSLGPERRSWSLDAVAGECGEKSAAFILLQAAAAPAVEDQHARNLETAALQADVFNKPAAPVEREACSCSYGDSDEMTRHAPLCPRAGSW